MDVQLLLVDLRKTPQSEVIDHLFNIGRLLAFSDVNPEKEYIEPGLVVKDDAWKLDAGWSVMDRQERL